MRKLDDVIVSLATPPLRSALLVVRVAGNGAFAFTDRLFSKKISGICSRKSYVGIISNHKKEAIDEVVLLAYPAGKSPTGEETVEIMAHGSPLIGENIVNAYLSLGARQAERGEFSLRSYLNGKMNLVEAEAVNDMINAQTEESRKKAFLSLKGETSELLSPIMEELGKLVASTEVSIDFPEYNEFEENATGGSKDSVCRLISNLDELLDGAKKGHLYQNGVTVALVGKPNVGKSSLLNALLGEEKAIVTDIPGTTRDIVEGTLSYKGVPLHFLDTAGIRESNDQIESIGVSLTLKAIDKADVVVEVLDASCPVSVETKKDGRVTIVVENKADLVKEKKDGVIYISAKEGDVAALLEAIYQNLGFTSADCVTPSFSSERQISLLYKMKNALVEAKNAIEDEQPISIVSINYLDAYNCCKELLGLEADRDVEDEVFSRFCVGK